MKKTLFFVITMSSLASAAQNGLPSSRAEALTLFDPFYIDPVQQAAYVQPEVQVQPVQAHVNLPAFQQQLPVVPVQGQLVENPDRQVALRVAADQQQLMRAGSFPQSIVAVENYLDQLHPKAKPAVVGLAAGTVVGTLFAPTLCQGFNGLALAASWASAFALGYKGFRAGFKATSSTPVIVPEAQPTQRLLLLDIEEHDAEVNDDRQLAVITNQNQPLATIDQGAQQAIVRYGSYLNHRYPMAQPVIAGMGAGTILGAYAGQGIATFGAGLAVFVGMFYGIPFVIGGTLGDLNRLSDRIFDGVAVLADRAAVLLEQDEARQREAVAELADLLNR